MNVKDESENLDLKTQNSENEDHGIQSHHCMANRCGNNGNSDRLYFLVLQNHRGRWLQPWKDKTLATWEKKAMTNQDSMLKSRDITLPTKVRPVKDTVFPAVVYGCESWTGRKAAGRNIDAFGLWSWRRLLRVPWTAAKSKPPILKETNPEYSSEELMLPLKLPILRPPATKNWLIRTDPDGGQDSRRGEEGDDRKGRD